MDSRRLASLLAIGGTGLVAIALSQFLAGNPSSVTQLHILSNLSLTGGAGIGLLYVSYWHSARSFTPKRNRRILAWTIGGAFVLTTESIVIQPLVQETLTRSELRHLLQVNAGSGLLFGAVVGTFEAQALTSAADATRAETRLEDFEAERQRWNELNTVLRHYLLNSVTVIDTRLSELRPAVPGDKQSHLNTIADRLETITTIGTHVDHLAPSIDEEGITTVGDLQTTFDRAASRAEIDVSCTIDSPEESEAVRVGDRVEQDLALFLEALATVLEPNGTIACSCASTTEQVTCRLTASPAALPEAIETALFEPIERKSGLKFYLAETAIDAYADVGLDQNSDGTVAFEIDFETASTDA